MWRISLAFLVLTAVLWSGLGQAWAALQWEQVGPDGGDLFGIEASPADPNDLFALSFLAVFRSTDAGANWQAVHTPDMGAGFVSLAFDPQDADHLFLASGTKGVWESLDGGDNWTSCVAGLPPHPDFQDFFYPVTSLAATPDGRLFAGLGELEGYPDPPAWVYRSDGGCGAWTADGAGISVGAPPATQDIVTLLSLDAADRLWAMIHGGGVFRQQGGGWQARNANLPPEALLGTYLETDPADSGRLLLGTERDWVYETQNSGQTWTLMALPDDLLGLPILPLVYNIAVDPNNAALLYVLALDGATSNDTPLFSAHAGDQLDGGAGYLSGDGGDEWIVFPRFLARIWMDPSETVATDLPPFGPLTRSRTWFATSFGVDNLRHSDDGALSFETLNTGITSVLVNNVWLHPSPPAPYQTLLFAAAESGLHLRRDGAPLWDRQKATANTLYNWSFAADPLDGEEIYYSTGYPAHIFPEDRGIYRVGLDCFGEGCALGEPLLVDTGVWRVITTPLQPLTVYAATQEEGILVSQDRGQNWAPMNAGLSLPQSITDIALDAAGLPLLAAARTSNGDFDAEPPQIWPPYKGELGGVYRFDGGQWLAVPDIAAAVYDLEAHPQDGQTFLAATAEGIYETLDGGLTWQSLLASTLVHDLVIDPQAPHYIYAGTRDGVLRSTDGGIQWHDLSDDLWQTVVYSIALDDPTGILYAGTAGGSVFRQLPDPNPRPAIALEPATLAFDITPVGFTEEATVTVVNEGEADLIIDNIVPFSPALSLVDLELPITLTPGGELDLTIAFSPLSVGLLDSQLSLISNDPISPIIAYPITGEGREAVPAAPDVKLDGVDGPISVPNAATIQFTADLTAGDYLGLDADFWVLWVRADGAFLWLTQESAWVESPSPLLFYTGVIFEPWTLAIDITGVISGVNFILFAVDDNADGLFNGTWKDFAGFLVEAAPPQVSTFPESLDFGMTPIGLSSDEPFAVLNQGEADLIVNGIDLGDPKYELVDPPAFPFSIASGQSVVLTARFSPPSAGPSNSQLTIHSNDPQSPALGFPVSGEGEAAIPPVPDVKLDGVDGPVTVPKGGTLRATLDLSAGDYFGQDTDYWVRWSRPDGTTHWLTQGSGWVQSQSPVLFFSGPVLNQTIVSFNIAAILTGAHDLLFAVDDNADGVFDATWFDSASFTVEAAPPQLLTFPTALDFALTRVGFSRSLPLALANLGEEDLVVSAIDIGAAAFELVSPPSFPVSVAAGAPLNLTVRFSPQSVGSINSQLTIQSNDPLAPAVVIPMSGEGT